MSFPRYPKYKDSGVEWLGAVPEHWSVDRLKRSTVACQNGVWGDEPQQDENDIPCVRVADFDRQRLRVKLTEPTIRNVAEKERVSRTLRPGDLLLEKSGGGAGQPVGCVVLYDDSRPAICSNFVARVQVAQGMSPSFWRYLHAAAYSVRLNVRSIKQTSGIQNLDAGQYLDERAGFPPPGEQDAIATFLDRETAKIDTLVAEQRRLMEILKEKRQTVISHAVTKGLNPDAQMKTSGVEGFGEMPAHWTSSHLRRLAAPGTTITYGIVQAGPDTEDGIPYIRTSDMFGDALPQAGYMRTTPEIDASYSRSKVAPDDLVVAIRASLGKGLLVPDHLRGANLTQGTARISPGKLLVPRFLLWAFNSNYCQASIHLVAKGTTFLEITLDSLRRIALLVPPLAEQVDIAAFLDRETTRLDQLVAEAQRAIDLLQERRAALISAAVTGQIDVRGFVEAA